MTQEELKTRMSRVTIFSGLTSSRLDEIIASCSIQSYPAGCRIIEEGTPATHIFILLSGAVRVVHGAPPRAFEICSFGPGCCIGEASIVGIFDHTASVEITEPAQILILSRNTLMSIYDRDKDFFSILILNIARELARRLNRTDQMLYNYLEKQ